MRAYGLERAAEIQEVGLPVLAALATLAIRSETMSVRLRPVALAAPGGADVEPAMTR